MRSPRLALAGIGRLPRLLAVATCLLLAVVSALHGTGERAAASPDTVPVVVAAHVLPPGRVLQAPDLTVARWPRRLRPAGALARAPAAVGERLAGAMGRGEPLTRSRLVGAELTDGLPAGTAAVPVTLADPQAAGLVHPGDHVDLLATPRQDLDVTAPRNSVDVISDGLVVLAVRVGREDEPSTVVLAADHATTLRITRVSTGNVFTVVHTAP